MTVLELETDLTATGELRLELPTPLPPGRTESRLKARRRATFPSADKVGDLIVFNVGGNKYRLITSIHFNRGKVYIRNALTHREYDEGAWKQ